MPPSVPFPCNSSCCLGDETFEHGEVIKTFPDLCFKLVCDDGQVVEEEASEECHSELGGERK